MASGIFEARLDHAQVAGDRWACGEVAMRWADIGKAAVVLLAMAAGARLGAHYADVWGMPPGLIVAPAMVAALLLAIGVVRRL